MEVRESNILVYLRILVHALNDYKHINNTLHREKWQFGGAHFVSCQSMLYTCWVRCYMNPVLKYTPTALFTWFSLNASNCTERFDIWTSTSYMLRIYRLTSLVLSCNLNDACFFMVQLTFSFNLDCKIWDIIVL